jgi:Na+-driven multidrug efflux pump
VITFVLLAVASVVMFFFITPIAGSTTTTRRSFAGAKRFGFSYFPAAVRNLHGPGRGSARRRDTKWVMYITAIGNWGVRLVFSLLFVFVFDLGLNGFWLAMGVDIVIRPS